jgi:hypothetical protein
VPRLLARWFGEQQGARLCAKAALRQGVPLALTLIDALIVAGGDADQPSYVHQMTPPGSGDPEQVAAD